MASPTPKRITVDEFLAGLASNSERLELIDGVVTVIVGGTAAAHLIAGNIFGNLFNRLRGGPLRSLRRWDARHGGRAQRLCA